MTIGERIKEVRKSNTLTLEKFGAAIQIKAQSVSLIEKGINNPSKQTITLICSRFNVSEEWLRTGAGEMSAGSYEDELEKMCAKRGLSHADYVAIRNLMEMPREARDAVMGYMLKFAADIAAEQIPAVAPSKSKPPSRDQEAERVGESIKDEIRNGGEKVPESGTPPAGAGTA